MSDYYEEYKNRSKANEDHYQRMSKITEEYHYQRMSKITEEYQQNAFRSNNNFIIGFIIWIVLMGMLSSAPVQHVQNDKPVVSRPVNKGSK